MGWSFIKVVEESYDKQKAKIIVNDNLTEVIVIGKKTRQCCPLFPLLFILTLEVFTRAIKDNPAIKRVSIEGFDFKLQASP